MSSFLRRKQRQGSPSNRSRQDLNQLQEKFSALTDRIRTLENALQAECLARGGRAYPHPLLRADLLEIKNISNPENRDQAVLIQGDEDLSGGEEYSELQDAFGALAIKEDLGTTYLGATATENLLLMVCLRDPLDMLCTSQG